MRGILPGRPRAKLQAVSVGVWRGIQIIAYITGRAFVVLDTPDHLLQTTYVDDNGDLEAIAVDDTTGKIAVCSKSNVLVYKPYGLEERAVKWSLESQYSSPAFNNVFVTLSWGADEELLVGGSFLTLVTAHNGMNMILEKRLPRSLKLAQFSHDGTLIASTSNHDRLVKIWRRLASGTSEERFDYAYLSHPTVVTGLHWRKPFHREQIMDQVLYTSCADRKIRIWTSCDHHSIQLLQFWSEIDMVESIKPRTIPPESASQKRFSFIIDSRILTAATERAVQQSSSHEKESPALDHLIAVAHRNPEICMIFDDKGNMSAWGLENVGGKVKKTSDIFCIAHTEGLQLHHANESEEGLDNSQFYTFCGEKSDSCLTILVHHFDGRLIWFESNIDQLFDPSPKAQRIHRKMVLTGHSSHIKKVNRSASGRAILSRTSNDETIIWTQRKENDRVPIRRHSIVSAKDRIRRTWLLQEGDFVAFLHDKSVSLWDARARMAHEISRCEHNLEGEFLCLLMLPETEGNRKTVHLAAVMSTRKGIVWEIHLPGKENLETNRRHSSPQESDKGHPTKFISNGTRKISIAEFCTFDLGKAADLAFMVPVDPAGTTPVISGFLDIFARDVALSCSNSGHLTAWTARIDLEKKRVDWLVTSTIDTDLDGVSLVSGTSIRKAALVDKSQSLLTIWNTRSGKLEHDENFDGQGFIQDLDWSSTPDDQSVLAIGFPHRVIIYTQLRYDYLNAGPSWAAIREVQIRDYTPHPIGDSVWLGNGNLVIGAGNQLFVQDALIQVSEALIPGVRMTARKKASVDMFTLVSRMNGPLPVFHPQLLSQCMLSGKISLVQEIVVNLYKALKFWTDGDDLDSFLGLRLDRFSREGQITTMDVKRDLQTSYTDFSESEEPTTVNDEVSSDLQEKLTRLEIPQLSSREQFHLVQIIECISTVEKHRRSIDENAARFLLFFQHHTLGSVRNTAKVSQLSWREICWAHYSNSQDILVDLVGRYYQGRMLWRDARESGIFMWVSELTILRAQFETIARNEYTKTQEKSPVDCSLYYLALKKKNVLMGLWRMATWSREQGATQRLLANNFQESRWKTAALKNAYALMGKRRFEYAAAFFLLGDRLADAVSVLSNQLQDLQLAIAVARVYEGDDGPVLRQFLIDRVLPLAVMEGNRWLANWAFWMLNKRDNAVRALVSPLASLLSPSSSPRFQSKLFLTDDPGLIVLYKHLRDKSLQTLRGAVMVSPRREWEFVTHMAGLYVRMGCDLLALDLVRNWEFLAPQPPPLKASGMQSQSLADSIHSIQKQMTPTDPEFDPRKLLRRRSSLVVADLPSPTATRHTLENSISEDAEANEGKEAPEQRAQNAAKPAGEGKKRQPTQFSEPDASSLLDSFGF